MNATLWEVSGPWKGRLAVVPRPRGGDWLEDEIEALREAGVDMLVSALTASEIAELDLAREEDRCGAHGIEYVLFPIQDYSVPASIRATAALVERITTSLADGKGVATHCRGGVGRSPLLAACVLAMSGIDVATAFEGIGAARGCPVPDTAEQRAWMEQFARENAPVTRRAAS
ncbi:MAG: tyrosine protein phosphatase [Dehalococcoidia bacterium]